MTPAIGAVAFTPAVPVVTHTVPVTHVTTVAPPMPMLGEGPGQAVCPTCQTTVVTEVVRTPGLMAWLIVAGIAIFGFLPCAFIPLCVDSCKDVNHHCPCCHRLIYSHKKM
ncbi:LITAF domain-containing protein-like isoform X1 [Stigmatopora argus]